MKLRILRPLAVLGIAMSFFASCASTTVNFGDTDEEMSIMTLEDGKLTEKHYSVEELQKMSVLVLNTKNTERSIEMLDNLAASAKKFRNPTCAEDCDTKERIDYQNAQLQKIFGTVSFEGVAGESYDLVLLRDWYVIPGKLSYATTGVVVAYQFVYVTDDEMEEANGSKFLFRGFISFEGYGKIPYPATSYAVQEANKNAADGITEKLYSSGIDLLTLPSGERKFIATESSLAALKAEVASVQGNATAGTSTSTNSASQLTDTTTTKTTETQDKTAQTSSQTSSGTSSTYTSAKFKALLEKQK